MIVKSLQRRLDIEMLEQPFTVARVFCHDTIYCLENFYRSRYHVAQIADGRCHDIQGCGWRYGVDSNGHVLVSLFMKRSIVSHPFTCLWLVLAILLLPACGSVPRHQTTSGTTETFSIDQINVLLQKANQASSPTRDNLFLQVSEMLILQAKQTVTPNALNYLFEIRAEFLTPRNFAVYTRWYGQWALDNNQQDLARRLIDHATLETLLPTADESVAIPVYELRIRYFLQTEQPLRAIDQHSALAPLIVSTEKQQQQQSAFWSVLQQLSVEDKQLLMQQPNKQIHGWLQLLNIATAQELDLDEQVSQLETWLANNPRHPAAQSLPVELQLLQSATRERPQQITLLLPLSGNLQKAGEAVRDGFFAAYYQALQRGSVVPSVTLIDSQSHEDFMSLYQEASDNGAQLIIGPLEKEKVALLKEKSRVSVQTLALNDSIDQTDGKIQTTTNLFLFGLSPEDEARQIARQNQSQYRRALVIAPNNDWGQRISRAFIQHWKPVEPDNDAASLAPTDAHQVLGSALFDPKKEDYSTIIQQTLGIDDSQQRMRRVKPWITGDVEFEPRRRQDIDMIFLAARPEQARQINPLLAFHYAGDIPVYASSSAYAGGSQSEKDNDLNGIRVLISPWLLNANPLRSTLEKQPSTQTSLQNLYAMGADAWRLHARLHLLANSAQGRLHGNTGILQIEEGQRVTRLQQWARMEKGRPIPLAGTTAH